MKKIFYLSAIVFVAFSACKKDNTMTPILSQSFEVNSTGSTTWKYFSFASNDTVSIADPANSNAWDLAFQRYRIETNGGLSGKGSGSAANSFKKGQTGFDELTVVPDTTHLLLMHQSALLYNRATLTISLIRYYIHGSVLNLQPRERKSSQLITYI